MSITYKKSGVDISAGNALVEKIKPFAKSTANIGTTSDLGGFGALFDLKQCGFKDPILVSATDGVGTKLKLAFELNIHDTIGIDLVAMSVNDLVVQGAKPLFFLDYYSTSKLEVNMASEVVKGIAEGCKQAGCSLIGGETAEMPGIYQQNEYDLAGFAVGAVERDEILPKATKKGDILIGLRSSGLHSNGFSLARYILKEKNISLSHKLGSKTIGELLLEPTKIYVKSCLEAAKTGKIKAMAHITGGGLVENLPRVLGAGLEANIDYQSWQPNEIFSFLQKEGEVVDEEMHLTFNCGIGMVLVADKKDVELLTQNLKNSGEEPVIIGEIK